MNLAFGIAMFLFALFGFISIIGVLRAQYRKKQKKLWIISILINAVLLIGSVALYNHLLTPEEKNIIAIQQEQRKTEQSAKDMREAQKKVEQTPIIVHNEHPAAVKNTSPESILTSIASKRLGKDLKKIEVNDFVDDSTKKFVLVYYNGNVGYNNEMTKKAMFIQTAELFKELFTAGIPIQEVTAFIYADIKGPSGLHEALAMKCQLKGSNATNIDWRSINKPKFDQNLDYLWVAPGLKE